MFKLICKNCRREIIKSPYPKLHPSGYVHVEYPAWNCTIAETHPTIFSEEACEPLLFIDYLKQVELC